MIERLHDSTEVLHGRNGSGGRRRRAKHFFALTTILENQEMAVFSATNGRRRSS